MAQINKNKKLTDNQKIDSLTLENDNLFQSTDVDQSRKDLAKAVVNFAQQVINAENFKGRDLRLYNLGIQESVNKILKGELAYSESMTGDAKTNIFGYYSRFGQPSELDWMINETVKRASNGNATNQQNTPVNTEPMRQYVKVTPAAGFSSYVLPDTTVDLKVKNFAKHLSGQLTNYVNNPYDESKYIVEGINKDSVANFSNYVNTLDEISNRTSTPEDILKLGEIVSALGNEDLTNAFESYFAKELDGSEGDVQKQLAQDAQVSAENDVPVEQPKILTPTVQLPTEKESTEVQTKEIFEKTPTILAPQLKKVTLDLIGDPFTKVGITKDFISEENLNIEKSLLDFVKLYILAENGDTKSVNEIKKRFKRINENFKGRVAGDEIMGMVRHKSGIYDGILKYWIENTTDAKEKEILLAELLNKNKTVRSGRFLTDYKTQAKPSTVDYSRFNVHKTIQQKSGGKLDRLQNYISNKNGK